MHMAVDSMLMRDNQNLDLEVWAECKAAMSNSIKMLPWQCGFIFCKAIVRSTSLATARFTTEVLI